MSQLSQWQKALFVFLRIVFGWFYLYAGVSKLIDPQWSAAGYLAGAKTFPALYQFLASPSMLPIVNFINEWGLTLLGVSLIVGIGVRLSAKLGAALMLLYYLPVLTFPYVGQHALLVDEHILYIAVLLFLSAIRAGRVAGVDGWLAKLTLRAPYPALRDLIS